MNTVQVSTVNVTSNVEVIFVNSKFTIRAMYAVQAIERANARLSDPDVVIASDFLTELVNALEDNAEGRIPVQG